ncbi:MAG: DEAD/DEAH box helicase family protein [Candidatus Accumulibacter propinquus]|jgi:type III restriction enzyme
MASADNPILNSPYDEPARHYATDAQGNLNYRDIRPGRRIFTPDVPQIPIGQPNQGSMFDVNDFRAEYGEHLINRLRDELRAWRQAGYRGVTSRVTRDLLDYWFANPERAAHQKLFFAQQEAVEAAIWLNEVAEKSNTGTHIQNQLRQRQATAGDDPASQLPRIAFKMATGSGKTVVMACLILYHYLNRREYRNDTRYVDYFLILAPGITIRDRLNVLLPDQRNAPPAAARDYYQQRTLVPPAQQHALGELAHRLIITNYHEFLPRILGGNKRTPFDGKLGADGHKVENREDENQMLRRVLGSFKAGRRLLVINDEAHHCYLPRARGRDTELDNSETENERAAVWFSGLRACARRFQVRVVYDLSATPYYLSGSGFPAYSLFPWVVSDFGLIEAIEAGLVKIPFLPIDDSSQAIDEPVLKNLYENCKTELPRKGQRTQRRETQQANVGEAAPNLPALVRQALDQFYAHYEEYERGLRRRGELKADLFTAPPVFIVVCGNTAVSREVFKEIAGYERVDQSGQTTVVAGRFALFSNFDRDSGRARARPPTLLIDSDALEHSGQIDEGFKKVFAPEIERFKRAYRLRHPERGVDSLTDAELLREVVNTVGKPDTLGAHVRCVVSVAMLSEGWDANTVTHVMGLRAFGSQLLCEQVAGRALRRRYYFTDPKTGKFPPEYAHIIGIPFKLFKAGQSSPVEPPEYATLRALRERDSLEIRFPNLVGYRLQTDSDQLTADFSGTPDYRLDTTRLPVETTLGTAVSEDRQTMRLKLEELRDQTVIYKLTRDYLRRIHGDAAQRADLRLFQQVRQIVERWYDEKLKVVGEDDPIYKRLVIYQDPQPVVESINRGIVAHASERERVLPILNHYNPQGSTRHVFGHTSRNTWPTKKSHVNLVVADTNTWEQIAAKTLEKIPAVESYVKNAFLGFHIPYISGGKERAYLPDYLVRIRSEAGAMANLILEITGFNQDKELKRWAVRERWLPAVNNARGKLDLSAWHFAEITAIENIKPELEAAVGRIVADLEEDELMRDLLLIQSHTADSTWTDDDEHLFHPL